MDKKEYDQIGLDIENGFIDSRMGPLKCRSCKSDDLKESDHSYESQYLCEVTISCGKCGKVAGYWSYGEWLV